MSEDDWVEGARRSLRERSDDEEPAPDGPAGQDARPPAGDDGGLQPDDDVRAQDRRHLDAAVRMVATGASRWVIVSGIRDAGDLLERGRAAGSDQGVVVRALSATAVLVARADALPLAAPAGAPRVGGRLSHALHTLASILR